MCIGVPMRVVAVHEGWALCEGLAEVHGERRRIDMRLVGDQPPGTHILVFLDAAREVVSADDARLVASALEALSLATSGPATADDIDRLFPDLAGRTPELPAHLRKQPA